MRMLGTDTSRTGAGIEEGMSCIVIFMVCAIFIRRTTVVTMEKGGELCRNAV